MFKTLEVGPLHTYCLVGTIKASAGAVSREQWVALDIGGGWERADRCDQIRSIGAW